MARTDWVDGQDVDAPAMNSLGAEVNGKQTTLPSQTGHAGESLHTTGSALLWSPDTGGGAAATNLGVTRTSTQVVVTSDTGTDATILAADATNAGVMTVAQQVALTGKLDTSAAPELIRDTIGTALVQGANITITPNDAGDTITIAAAGGAGATNLTTTRTATTMTVLSDTGTDATLVAADGTNAGVMTAAQQVLLTGAIQTSTKNVANGVLGLNASGLANPAQLPSYVDDVLEFANFAAFPGTGETGKIYVAINSPPTTPSTEWRWSGTVYVQMVSSPGTTDAVTEGTTNLYYTNARADARVVAGITGKLDTSAAPELIRDTIGTALTAGTNVTITPNDAGDTIAISATPGAGSTNLTTTLAPTQVTVLSDTGTDAVIPAADGTNAGVMTAAQQIALAGKLDTSAAPELIRDTMGTALTAGANVTITPNDVGDVITIAATGGGGGGSTNEINVTAAPYSALNNDTGNQATAIQSAINAASAAGGGTVYFPAGTYRITAQLVLANNVSLRGDGASFVTGGSRIKQVTAGQHILYMATTTVPKGALEVRNLVLEHTAVTGTAHGLYLDNASGTATHPPFVSMSFRDLFIQGCTGYGFNAESLITSVVERVTCQNNGNGFYLNGDAYGTGWSSMNTSVTFTGCYANGNTGIGYNLKRSAYLALNGCAADSNGAQYMIETCQAVVLNGCGAEYGAAETPSIGDAYTIKGGSAGIVLDGCLALNNMHYSVWVTGGSTATVTGFMDSDQGPTAVNGLKVDVDSKATELGANTWTGSVSRPAQPYTIIDGAGAIGTQMDSPQFITPKITGTSGYMKFNASLDANEYNLGVSTTGTLALFGETPAASLDLNLSDGVLKTGNVTRMTNAGGIVKRRTAFANIASMTINADTTDVAENTGLTTAVTVNNPTGTPTAGQELVIALTGTAGRAITWGTAFEASAVPLPTTTVGTTRLDVTVRWNTATSKWRCVYVTVAAGGESGIGSVTVSGTPTAGQVPTAVTGTTATWQTPSGGGGGGTDVPSGWADVTKAPYNANNNYPTNSASSGNAIRAAAASGLPVWIPAGSYLFDGAGISQDDLYIMGPGPGQVQITLGTGVYFIDGTNIVNTLKLSGILFDGGAGVFRSTYTGVAVQGYRIFENCQFHNYTATAIGHRHQDSPYWGFYHCEFRGANDTACIGVALNGLNDDNIFHHCTFELNRIHLKLKEGANAHISGGCSFFRWIDYTANPRIDIWLVPRTAAEVTAAGGNFADAGSGFSIQETKFGNEGLSGNDYRVVIADALAGNFETALPQLAANSTSVWIGGTFTNLHNSLIGGTCPPFIYSTTPNLYAVQAGNFAHIGSDSLAAARVLQLRTATGFDPTINAIGPVMTGADSLFGQVLVAATTGTLTGQPPYVGAGGSGVAGLDAEGVRDTIAAALVAGTNVTITPNDAANTITIAASGGAGGGDASTNTATSVDNEVVLFSGTAGKTLKRSALSGIIKQTAGVQSVATAGTDYLTPGATQILTATQVRPRVLSPTASATPAYNVDNADKVIFSVTAAITSLTSGRTGTPYSEQPLWFVFIPTATFAIAWGTDFESSPAFTLPTTTSGTTRLDVTFAYNAATSKYRCMGFS